MKIHRSFEYLGEVRNPVVTIGTFDGVHVGHKTILNRLKKLAEEIDGETVLITFHPHPRKVLYPETAGKDLKLISTQREKINLLRQTGLDHLVIIEFTLEFSKITSYEFVENILVGRLNAKRIVVGFNHHFGHKREGDFAYLYELASHHDFKVEEIPEQDVENETVSSTVIRKALHEGRIQRANAYLDHFYIMTGNLSDGHPRCREIGFPTYTLNIEEDVKLVPPEGVYAVSLLCCHHKYKGMLNIKQFDEGEGVSVEVHLFGHDHELELRDEIATIRFHKRMRDELQIHEDQALHKQLERDKSEIRELIF
ncbi:MAG: riboflavin biosynthesis protein RibF [Bacteroidales bacterium]|nr:riboflavin biosynthesis protein RibF [Bacteroidales bacterium]